MKHIASLLIGSLKHIQVLLGIGCVLILVAGGLLLLQKPVAFQLDVEKIRQEGVNAFWVQLDDEVQWPWILRGDDMGANERSSLWIFEGERRMGPPHAIHSVIRERGGGAFSHWHGHVYFSTSDNSDPRSNGRFYSATGKATIRGEIVAKAALFGVLFLGLSAGGAVWANRTSLSAAIGGVGDHLRQRASDYVLAATIPTAVSVLVGMLVPPIWQGTDSAIWLIWQWELFPHYPMLYPAVMSMATSLFASPNAVLRFVLVLQHVFMILAVAYLASAFRRQFQIVIVSTLTCLGAGLSFFAHGLHTEGLAIPLLVFFLGASLRLARDGLTLPVALALFIGLVGSSLARHAHIVFGVVPIAYLVINACTSRIRQAPIDWKTLVVALLVLAAGWLSSKFLTQSSCQQLGVSCTSIVGRAGVYRIQEAYALVPADQQAAWLEAMAARMNEDIVKRAFPLMAQTPNPWTGPRDAVLALGGAEFRDADTLMNSAFLSFAFSGDRFALLQWAREFGKAVVDPNYKISFENQIESLLQRSETAIRDRYPLDKRILSAVVGTGAENVEFASQYSMLARHPVTRALDYLLPLKPAARAGLLLVSFTLVVATIGVVRSPELVGILAALWIGGVLYLLVLTFVTVVIPRYVTPVDIIVWLSNAISLSALLDVRGRREQRGSACGQY